MAHTGSTRAALEQIVSALAAIDHAAREGSEDDELLELVELAETANRGTEALLRVVLAVFLAGLLTVQSSVAVKPASIRKDRVSLT